MKRSKATPKPKEGKKDLQRLKELLASGRFEQAVQLVKSTADPLGRDRRGVSMLHIACQVGREDVVRELLSRGADPQTRDFDGHTPFDRCCWFGKHNLLQMFIEEMGVGKGQPSRGSLRNRSPLHDACRNGHVEAVRVLLDHGGWDLATPDYVAQRTPLQVACIHGRLAVVSLLLERGANMSIKDKYGWTPLQCACWHVHPRIVELMKTYGADCNAQLQKGLTLLHAASSKGRLDVAQLLLAQGASQSTQDILGLTPFHFACARGHSDVASLLFRNNPEECVSMTDRDGRTALHLASWNGKADMVSVMLDDLGAFPNVDVKSEGGWSPLHEACWTGMPLVVAKLLNAGADANARDDGQQTPLHAAAWSGNRKVISLLLQVADVDFKAEDGAGLTPLGRARYLDNQKVAVLLREHMLNKAHAAAEELRGGAAAVAGANKDGADKTANAPADSSSGKGSSDLNDNYVLADGELDGSDDDNDHNDDDDDGSDGDNAVVGYVGYDGNNVGGYEAVTDDNEGEGGCVTSRRVHASSYSFFFPLAQQHKCTFPHARAIPFILSATGAVVIATSTHAGWALSRPRAPVTVMVAPCWREAALWAWSSEGNRGSSTASSRGRAMTFVSGCVTSPCTR
eukprot:TRINITY_DN2666_c0_g1_i2.p1 TRINITY_DN2666_c0_g1~~TRINITY_DN2666_c0_g1_i2.p1  ORF type:complete len:628 (-),score=97.70 TRINITY_DN2666_c0_g1_i2:256-2139(-)